MRTSEFLTQARLDAGDLHAWIEAGWLRPRDNSADRNFSEVEFSDVDLARARLIFDLRADVGLNDEAIPVVLDLIDQIHGLRQLVRELIAMQNPKDHTRDRRPL